MTYGVTIQITALDHDVGGPDMPTRLGAELIDRDWPDGGTEKVLLLHLGGNIIEVRPANKEFISDLGRRLIELATKELS